MSAVRRRRRASRARPAASIVALTALFLAAMIRPATGSRASGVPLEGSLFAYQANDHDGHVFVMNLADGSLVARFVPPASQSPPHPWGNGRAVAVDPSDGNLWYAALNTKRFAGDGLIHKVGRRGGADVSTLAVPETQEHGRGIGALDDDFTTVHVLYAAGYQHDHGRAWLFRIDALTGDVLGSCSTRFRDDFGLGNDTLAVAVLPGLGKVLLTDAGDFGEGTLFALDPDSCAIRERFDLGVLMTGIDWDPSTGHLLVDVGEFTGIVESSKIVDFGPAPFDHQLGSFPMPPGSDVEDISLATPLRCAITGTPGDDVLSGTPAGEVICGLGGNDTIDGGGGGDVLRGGPGDDHLAGGEGIDIIQGSSGEDTEAGGPGTDLLTGGMGDDHLSGGAGNDRLRGGLGTDTLDGGSGTDECVGGEAVTGCEPSPSFA
jgi:Ca2+-binding RTX toxin-like protein